VCFGLNKKEKISARNGGLCEGRSLEEYFKRFI
jgi:hypothetical protein